ncbi:MAG: hypothetical protein RTU92_03235 [Candidatus Thorarchaeota archaeon]
MSTPIWWRREYRPGLIFIFLGIAGLVQIPVLWHASTYVQVLSAELQLVVSIGATVVLGGAYVLMAEAMFRWSTIVSKKKVRRRQREQTTFIGRLSNFARLTEDFPAFVGVGLLTCVFLMFYFVPFGISDVSSLPSWMAFLSFLDPLFVYPLAVNISAVITAIIASYMNHKIK